MFFIAGTTGHVGGTAARKLLQGGKQVRTLARDPQKAQALAQAGAEVRQGDWNDTAALASALEGVEAAFLMMPPAPPSPDFREAKAVLQSYKQALRQAPPPRLVLLSSIGSEQRSGVGLITSTSLMEQELGDLPFPTAFIRAGSFYENYLATLGPAAQYGTLPSFYQPLDRPVSMIATADIGELAAELLTSPWNGKRIIELGSDQTPNGVAAAMSEVLDRPVQPQAVPRDQWTATLQQFGFPPTVIPLYSEMIDAANSGWLHFGVPGTEHRPGKTSAAEVFRQAQANQPQNR